jgi:ABC-type nitrate/sulfonate/bicarbonate transport system ATPase subunit
MDLSGCAMSYEGNGRAHLQLERVSKSFQRDEETIPVLEEVSLSLLPGEFVSVIGPSGCGKSTLLNIIAGLEEPSDGTVLLSGDPLTPRLGHVGYMHQKDLLMPWRTVLDNAILGLEIRGVDRLEARRQALNLVEQFGLTGFENQFPFALSGGMRQRVAFLRTVLAEQDLILLDEPFGALDALTRSQMQEWLLNLWDGTEKSIVLVTHDVDEALFLSDRVYVLTARPGRVKSVLMTSLPRPRSYELLTQASFISLKTELLASLRQGA